MPGDEEGTPAEPPEDAGNPESAMDVMEEVKSVEGSALQVCETLLMSTSCDMRLTPA